MKIGRVQTSGDVFLAPMAGVSDLGFRTLARRYGAGLTYTEMISVCGLMYRNRQTQQLTAVAPIETPCAVQLFGSDPAVFAKAVVHPCILPFDLIDINMGCPVHKVVSRGEGSALMKDPARAADIVRACVEVADGRPVTAKIRAGWDKVTAPQFALAMQEAGAAAVTVHGRTRSQLYAGQCDLHVIAEVVQAVDVPVIGNGDVRSVEDYRRMKENTGCAGVMIARGAIGHTSLFAEVQGLDVEVDQKSDLRFHRDALLAQFDAHVACNLLKPHLIAAVSGRANAKQLRYAVGMAKTLEQLDAVIDAL